MMGVVDLTEERRKDVNWINMTQNRDQWRVLMNVVMNPPSGYIKDKAFHD
jgi:hypothetical protein